MSIFVYKLKSQHPTLIVVLGDLIKSSSNHNYLANYIIT